MRFSWLIPIALAPLVLGGCPSTPPPADVDMATPSPDLTTGADLAPPVINVLKRPSHSSTIAISDDDASVVVSNPDDRSVSIFVGATGTLRARVTTGDEPWAVVVHPDRTTAFVTNRAAATVVKITGIDTASPTVSAPVSVGSEPTGLALSPTGAQLFVAEWAEGRVSVINTATMTITRTLNNIRNPRALAVTNNGNTTDDDETLVVPEFYGEAQAGGEAKDDGRKGIVRLYRVQDGSALGTVTLNPLNATETGFGVGTAPNQLAAVNISGGLAYITSVSASPAGPPKFDNNIAPVVYVVDIAQKVEVRSATTGTVNLAKEVRKAIPDPNPANFLANLRDIDFLPGTSVAYFASEGGSAVQRVAFNSSAGITEFGSTQNKQIDVLGAAPNQCQEPNGIVVANTMQKAFVNCWVSRKLAVLDLNGQTVASVVESSPLPTTATGIAQVRGKHFYFTARARWSKDSWSSCGSCHPDGLSDNVTWIFGTGPRQTTSMDGSFSHGAGAQKQRIFNWTAVNDEMHDFEGNVRGTSGGIGAITNAPLQTDCGTLAKEVRVGTDANATLPAGLGTPTAKELQDGPTGLPAGVRCVKDWDEVNEFVKTIRPPRGRRTLDPASVARGAALFGDAAGACTKCHGGQGWTVSNRFYEPTTANVTKLNATNAFAKPAQWPTSYTFHSTFQIAAQPATAELAGFNAAATAPPQLACAIRNVGTFGIPGDVTATDALEIKAAGVTPANRAQGRGGYNVPSLYGLALGAPYLHHGQAKTLQELFTDTKWQSHTQAGAANFLTGGTAAQDREDLANFLLSIDANTTEQAVPTGFAAGCLL